MTLGQFVLQFLTLKPCCKISQKDLSFPGLGYGVGLSAGLIFGQISQILKVMALCNFWQLLILKPCLQDSSKLFKLWP